MNNVDAFIQRLKGFKPLIDRGEVPKKSVDACRSYLELPHFNKCAAALRPARAPAAAQKAVLCSCCPGMAENMRACTPATLRGGL